MARHLIVVGAILVMVAAQVCVAQPLPVPHAACPMKTRCCRMLPAQPTDAVKPQPPQVALVQAQPLLVAALPPLPAALPIPDAPVREVPTRTIVLRI